MCCCETWHSKAFRREKNQLVISLSKFTGGFLQDQELGEFGIYGVFLEEFKQVFDCDRSIQVLIILFQGKNSSQSYAYVNLEELCLIKTYENLVLNYDQL